MTKRFDLISSLENHKKSLKRKFQQYEAAIGLDRIQVFIPFERADAFEAAIFNTPPKNKLELIEIASNFEGQIE